MKYVVQIGWGLAVCALLWALGAPPWGMFLGALTLACARWEDRNDASPSTPVSAMQEADAGSERGARPARSRPWR
jgi:hypothetical protein